MEHTPVKEDEVELSQIVHSDRALLAHTRHTNQGYGNKGSKGAKGGSESPKKVAFAREANVSSRLPSEIEKKSILRYLKKDVSKTQLYKSLPIYLLVLLLISISLLLQRKDDPTGYWANAYAKDVLLLSSDQFHKVDSEKTFWTWLERVALTEESGLGISIPSDEYVFQVTSFSALIQFRGLMSECSDNAELHAISPHRKYAAPAYCLSEYSDSDANTSAYGPLLKDGSPLFKANCDLERPLDGLVLNAKVETYADALNSFTTLLPNAPLEARASRELSLLKQLAVEEEDYLRAAQLKKQLQHIRGELLVKDCGETREPTGCGNEFGCHWVPEEAACVSNASRCYGLSSEQRCLESEDLCAWSGTGCHPSCTEYITETFCLVSGCYYNTTNASCVDATPSVMRTVQGLKNNRWIDEQTRAVGVEQLLYNPHSRHFILVTHFVEILPVGVWLPQIRSVPFHLFSLHSVKNRVMFALDIIVTLYIVWSVLAVYLSWKHNKDMHDVNHIEDEDASSDKSRSRWSKVKSKAWAWVQAVDFYIFFEFGFTGLFAAAYTFKWMMWSQGISMTNRSDLTLDTPEMEADVTVWNDLVHYVHLAKKEKVVYASAVIFAWLRLFSYVQYNERLNSLTETIKVATGSLISLVIIFFIIFMGFVFAGNLAFGADLREFNTVAKSAGYMVRLLFSAEIDNYDQFRQIESIWSIIYFGLFFSLAWLVLLNMVLAIITSSFNIVKENAKGENGEGKAPSWKMKSVLRDIKKFFGRLTSRGQPFAFQNNSVQRAATKSYDYYYDAEGKQRRVKKRTSRADAASSSSSNDGPNKALALVKGNYVVDRIKAIQILDMSASSSSSESTAVTPRRRRRLQKKKKKKLLESSSDEADPQYLSLVDLRNKLKHLHPDAVKRIFTKASNETSFGSRALRRGERAAQLMQQKMGAVEEKVEGVGKNTEEHERLLQESLGDLHAVQAELGTGRITDIHAATHNIDNNVYSLPPQLTRNVKFALESRLSTLQKKMEEPMDDLLDNMDDLLEMLNVPHVMAAAPHQQQPTDHKAGTVGRNGGGVTSPAPPPAPLFASFTERTNNPLDEEFTPTNTPKAHGRRNGDRLDSSVRSRRGRQAREEEGGGLNSSVKRTTLVEGVVDMPSAPQSPLVAGSGRLSPPA